MKNLSKRLFCFCEGAIKHISIIPLTMLFVFTLLFQNTISFDIFEKSTIVPNGLAFFLVFIFSVPILYGIYKLLKIIPEKVFFTVLALAYLLAGIYCITHIQMTPRHDSAICYTSALNYKAGYFINLQFGEYFYEYPHQLGLVTYNRILVWLSENVNIVYYTNLLWVILTNFFIWRTSCLLYKENPVLRKLIILFSFGFLPQLFYLFFAYGQVPGTLCMVISLFFFVKYLEKNHPVSFLAGCLFLSLTCLLRKNFLIGGIALLIIFFLKALKSQKLFYVFLMIALVASLIVPSKLVTRHYENIGGTKLNQGSPALLHVAMGLQENDDIWRAAGWFNGYNETTYELNNFDPASSSEEALASISDSLFTFKCDPKYALDFFTEKIITTWCDPTFQSIWSGPLVSLGNVAESSLLENLYSGGSVYRLLAFAMNIFMALTFLFSAAFVIIKTFVKKESLNGAELFSLLIFIGGFLFHLVWETKCQYVYPYVVTLIPVACCGMTQVFGYVDNFFKQYKNSSDTN